jgi:hypothetical protein
LYRFEELIFLGKEIRDGHIPDNIDYETCILKRTGYQVGLLSR